MATVDDIIKAFPGVGPLLNVSELRSIFEQGLANDWTWPMVEQKIYSSNWYRNHTAQNRQWAVLGPADKESHIKQWAAQIVAEYDSMFGLDFIKGWNKENPDDAGYYNSISNPHIRNLAYQVASGKMPWEYMQYLIRKEAMKRPDTAFSIAEKERQAQIKRLAQRPEEIAEEFWNRGRREYRVPLTETTALAWAKKVNSGEASEHDFNNYLRERAKNIYTTFAAEIDRGMLPSELLDDYTTIAARLLERSQDDVYFDPRTSKELLHPLTNPKVSQSLFGTDMPTLTDYASYIRKLPGWNDTLNARQEAFNLIRAFGQQFGVVV